MPQLLFRPVGITFRKESFCKVTENDTIDLRHEPKEIDGRNYPDCIGVYRQNELIGYVPESIDPRSPQQTIISLIRDKRTHGAFVSSVQIAEEDIELGRNSSKAVFKKGEPLSAVITVNYAEPEFVLLQSFNEAVKVQFCHEKHLYRYEGRPLTGATTYIKRWLPEFDSSGIAQRCAGAWQVEAGDILALWNSNRDIAGGFGTAIHAAIEHWHTYEKLGATIHANSKKDSNAALPKHPILRALIEQYAELHAKTHKNAVSVYPEALLTNVAEGLCGQADLVVVTDPERKICEIDDFKVNIEPEKVESGKLLPPFDHLPNNKLSKVTLQLNLLASYMRKSGWTVSKLNAFYLEDKWKHYDIPLLGQNA